MSLDYNSMRIFALTLSHRAIDDIRRDGLRQLRNYVDMCAILAKHPLAQRFFEYAQTLFEEPEPPYYTLAQRLIGSVSEDTLCTLGVNFGFGSMLYGSEKLAENLKEGYPISWVTFSTSDDPRLAAEIETGERLGSLLWGIYLKGPVSTALLSLIEQHPQSTFQLAVEPEYLNKSAVCQLSKLSNVVLAVCLPNTELTSAAKDAFEWLAAKRMLYAAFLRFGDAEVNTVFHSNWLEDLAVYTPFCVCSRKPGMSEQCSEALRKEIWSNRLRVGGRLFLVDWESDLSVIGDHMPPQVGSRFSPTLTPDMPMYF